MCYNGNYKMKQYRKEELIYKSCLSPNYSLQFENMKLESLVIVEQHATVKFLPNLVHTARHTMGISFVWKGVCLLE